MPRNQRPRACAVPNSCRDALLGLNSVGRTSTITSENDEPACVVGVGLEAERDDLDLPDLPLLAMPPTGRETST